jgi:DNA-binding NarL/FixJ family response regulator
LLAAATALRDAISYPLDTVEREYHAALNDWLQAALGEVDYRRIQVAGETLPLDDAIELALSPPADSTPPRGNHPLSRREQEVLRRIVDGRTNQEIAADLSISPTTVATHVASILNKLGVASRTAAATLAVRQHLV